MTLECRPTTPSSDGSPSASPCKVQRDCQEKPKSWVLHPRTGSKTKQVPKHKAENRTLRHKAAPVSSEGSGERTPGTRGPYLRLCLWESRPGTDGKRKTGTRPLGLLAKTKPQLWDMNEHSQPVLVKVSSYFVGSEIPNLERQGNILFHQ